MLSGLYLSTVLFQGSTSRGRPLVGCYEVAEPSHTWSGGQDDLLFRDAKGPDASLLIWNFFKQFSR
jgi:poly(3-hydroxybutyrate) depolymerase